MKVYILSEIETDYLEIWEFTKIIGIYSTKAKAKATAKKLQLENFNILELKVDK